MTAEIVALIAFVVTYTTANFFMWRARVRSLANALRVDYPDLADHIERELL